MVFSSYLFLFFFLPLALACYYAVPPKLRHLVLTYIAPIERSAKLRESSERRDHGHEKTMDRQGKARDSA